MESTNGLTNGQWHALYSWLDIKQADGKWYPSDLAVAEIKPQWPPWPKRLNRSSPRPAKADEVGPTAGTDKLTLPSNK